MATLARFILETDHPSGRTLTSIFSASDNPSVYKIRANRRTIRTDELTFNFVLVDELKWIIRLDR